MVDKDQGLLCELSWCDVWFEHIFGSDIVGFALQQVLYALWSSKPYRFIFLCACIHVLVYEYMCMFVGACALAACSHHNCMHLVSFLYLNHFLQLVDWIFLWQILAINISINFSQATLFGIERITFKSFLIEILIASSAYSFCRC
jgi:hypothetical protein